MESVSEARRHRLASVARARAEHERADQTGDAGIGVHDGAAREVYGAPLEGEARVCHQGQEVRLRGGLGGR